MIRTIQTLVLLLTVVAAVAVAASRLKIPQSILLVLAGVVLAVIPGLPTVALAPELVLLLVLPPVIYASAKSNRRWRADGDHTMKRDTTKPARYWTKSAPVLDFHDG